MNFFNNVNSSENWAKAKNLYYQRIFPKKSDADRTKDILQSLAALADISFDEIV
jgi:hypothetical protein